MRDAKEEKKLKQYAEEKEKLLAARRQIEHEKFVAKQKIRYFHTLTSRASYKKIACSH